ncbi:MAG: PrgI family protein [Chloroflexi bacterium]|nr:PrgI family protein [Chloroflexota bacterium]
MRLERIWSKRAGSGTDRPESWNPHGTAISTLSSNNAEETPVQRHEVPTHLNIEDKAFAGLTMRQLMVAIIGLALAYSAMSEAPLPLVVRLAAGATVLLMTAAISLWQPAGRSLEDWAFVLLRYVSLPRVVVWRVRASRPVVAAEEARFEVLLPDREELDTRSRSRQR